MSATTDRGGDVTVLYHGGGCWDGLVAAWCVRLAFPDALFLPANYGQPVPDVAGRRVILVDFSFPAAGLIELAGRNRSVVTLDHHDVEAELRAAADAVGDPERFAFAFNADKSGARLAWEWVWGRIAQSPAAEWTQRVGRQHCTLADPHWLVRYVEDRDLWRWALPLSREVNAGLRSYPLAFETLDALAAGSCVRDLAAEGRAVLRKEQQIIDAHVRNAVPTQIGGHTVPAVNATTLMSEIGNELSKGHPFSASYYDDLPAGVRRWSLRSQADGANVTEIARAMGGGGHPSGRAAGFQTPLPGVPA